MIQKLKFNSILFLIIVFIFNSLTFEAKEIEKLPEGVSVYILDNGLEVMLIEKPTLPMIGINTIVKTGSAFETFKTSGMSHMLEHLLFNGTSTMTQKELYDSTDIIGGYNNAHTGEYFTNFMMVTPSNNIIDGMKLQAAMLFDSVIPEEKFEKEKGIVLEEIAKSLGKSTEQLERNIRSVIYEGHALSLPTLGTYSTIANMTRDEVYAYYKNAYVPNNMIVNVIGNFNTVDMLKNLNDIYGKISPGEVVHSDLQELAIGFNKSAKSNLDKVFHRFYKGENTHVDLYFELTGYSSSDFTKILQIAFDEKKERIKEDLNKKCNDFIKTIEFSIREKPVKNYIEVNFTVNDSLNIEKLRNSFIDLMSKEIYDISEATLNNESIKNRTRFLQNIEKPHMFGIYNADIFAEKGIEGILSSYSGKGFNAAANELRKFKFPQEHITIIQHPEFASETAAASKSVDAELFEGSNGLPIIITKQAKGSDLLAIHYLIKNKSEIEDQFGKDAAKIWHETFGERMKSPEIHQESSKYGFTFTVNDNPFIPMDDIYLSPEFGYIRVEGIADDVKGAIDFLNKQMLSFIPTQEEYNAAAAQSMKPAMMGHGNKAQRIFSDKLEETLYASKTEEAGNKELTLENLIEFGKKYFVPSNMIISVVSPEEGKMIKEYFSGFSGGSNSNDNLGYIKEFKSIDLPVKIELEGGGEQSYLYYGYQKTISDNEEAGLTVLSLLLSDYIVFDIREKQGMAYRMSAGIDIIKNKAMFYINMGTRPENVDKLISQFPNFFSANFAEQVTDESVKRSVNMYLGRMMFRRLSSINQAYYLGHSKYFYNDFNYDSKSLDDLTNVTAETVKTLAKKYLEVDNQVEIYVR